MLSMTKLVFICTMMNTEWELFELELQHRDLENDIMVMFLRAVKQPLQISLRDFILRIQTEGKEKERVDQPFRIFAK